mmetsp:Transcript_63017/g.117891  ORF Transcript_63017/g.117891 Transcript_63017/m.117891 type:complete len:461 (-) Transcript_63017:31-1413(-)
MASERIFSATLSIEEPSSPNSSRAEVSSFVEFPVEIEKDNKPSLQSNTEAIFNLLNNALGVSLLATGWVCSEVGIVLGLLLYGLSNFLNRYTLHLLYRSCQLAKVKVSYPDIGQWCFGLVGFRLIATIMTIQMCCTCTAYAVTVAEVLAETFEWQEAPKRATGVAFLLLVPFTLIRSLKRIAILSTVATIACIIQMLAIAIPCYIDVAQGITHVPHLGDNGGEPGPMLYYTLDPAKIIKVLPVILLAYSTQASAPVILASMQDNSWPNVRWVTGFVYVLLYVISAVFGHSIYLRYTDLCTNSALTTIGQRPQDQLARWCGFVLVFISYIFMIFPIRNVLMSSCLGKDELHHEASYGVFAVVSVGLGMGLSMLALIAKALGGLELCLRFGGGCCATLMAMVFPPLLFVRTRAERGWDARVVCGSRGGLAMILAIGTCVWILSNECLFSDIMKEIRARSTTA